MGGLSFFIFHWKGVSDRKQPGIRGEDGHV